jgi:FKBP-type peptidyl-prolyl cis-trans isomerase FkpA
MFLKITPFFLILCFLSCSDSSKDNRMAKTKGSEFKKPLLKANKGLIVKERDEIDAYVLRRNWQMEKSGSGLRYMIYKKGAGEIAIAGKYALINYKITLLDGTECYRSKDKPERFLIDRDNVESGLHEAIKLMHEGDKAIIILPPHLAHGLIGDQDKIPPLSTIIYDVELVAVK